MSDRQTWQPMIAAVLVLTALVGGCTDDGPTRAGPSTTSRERASTADTVAPTSAEPTTPTIVETTPSTTSETSPSTTVATVPVDGAGLPLTRTDFPNVGDAEPDAEIADLLAFAIGGGPDCFALDGPTDRPVLVDAATLSSVAEVEVGMLFDVCWDAAPDGVQIADPAGRAVAPGMSFGQVVLPGGPAGTYTAEPLGGGPSFSFEVVPATSARMVVATPDDDDLAPDGSLSVDILLTGYTPDARIPVAVYEGGGVGYIQDGVPSDPPGPLLGVIHVATDRSGSAHLVLHATDPEEARCALVLPDPEALLDQPSPLEMSGEDGAYLLHSLDGVADSVCFETVRDRLTGAP